MRWMPLVWFACCAAFVGGCSKAPKIKTYPVSGTVSYNDKPVAGATVAFVSKNPDALRATGITDAQGKFELGTYAGPTEFLKGAEEGDYDVIVFKQAANTSASGSASMDTPEKREKMMAEMWTKEKPSVPGRIAPPPPPEVKWEVPPKYAKVDTSGLTAKVVAGENKPLEFKLSD